MPRPSRMSGRKSAMPPSDSMLKPWQKTTSVTVTAASRRRGDVGKDEEDTDGPERSGRRRGHGRKLRHNPLGGKIPPRQGFLQRKDPNPQPHPHILYPPFPLPPPHFVP